MLPTYNGPAVTLYRGGRLAQPMPSYLRDVLDDQGGCSPRVLHKDGGRNVMLVGASCLKAHVPAKAIICHVGGHAEDVYEEAEYLVDRRRLGTVELLRRHIK